MYTVGTFKDYLFAVVLTNLTQRDISRYTVGYKPILTDHLKTTERSSTKNTNVDKIRISPTAVMNKNSDYNGSTKETSNTMGYQVAI